MPPEDRFVTRFAAELEVDLDGLALAVSEAMANAIAHGYPGDAAGTIELSAGVSPFEVTGTTERSDGPRVPIASSVSGYPRRAGSIVPR